MSSRIRTSRITVAFGTRTNQGRSTLNRRTIEIVYFTMSRKRETRRKVDPYRAWFFNVTFYLIGFCHLRKEVRIFVLDRIKLLHQTKETFEVPEDFSLEEFTGRSFGVYQGDPVHVRIWFSPEVAGYVKEKIWHESQVIEPQADGSIIFEAEVARGDGEDQVLGAKLGLRGPGARTSGTEERRSAAVWDG